MVFKLCGARLDLTSVQFKEKMVHYLCKLFFFEFAGNRLIVAGNDMMLTYLH